MALKHFLHILLPLRQALGPELYGDLQTLAQHKGTPAGQLASDMIGEAIHKDRVSENVRARWETLTARQRQIVRMVRQGCDNREIAHRLTLSLDSVKNHIRPAQFKLHLPTKASLHLPRPGQAAQEDAP